jgi:hypothetical protein
LQGVLAQAKNGDELFDKRNFSLVLSDGPIILSTAGDALRAAKASFAFPGTLPRSVGTLCGISSISQVLSFVFMTKNYNVLLLLNCKICSWNTSRIFGFVVPNHHL